MTKQELLKQVKNRGKGDVLCVKNADLRELDLTGEDLRGVDFSWSDLSGTRLDGADLDGATLDNAMMNHCSLRGTSLRDASVQGVNFRWSDLTGLHVEGSNLWRSVFEYAVMDGIVADGRTRFFRMFCPETGAFLAYKKCFNDRLVQLLVPADARRVSAACNACRCDKAKVLTIKSFDYKERFSEAWSLVDENFVYRVGEWVEAKNYNPDRWMESTGGIHFWMSREEALAY